MTPRLRHRPDAAGSTATSRSCGTGAGTTSSGNPTNQFAASPTPRTWQQSARSGRRPAPKLAVCRVAQRLQRAARRRLCGWRLRRLVGAVLRAGSRCGRCGGRRGRRHDLSGNHRRRRMRIEQLEADRHARVLAGAVRRRLVNVGIRAAFGLAAFEEFAVVGNRHIVPGHRRHLFGVHRPHDLRRHQNQKLGLFLQRTLAREQRPDDRHVAPAGSGDRCAVLP